MSNLKIAKPFPIPSPSMRYEVSTSLASLNGQQVNARRIMHLFDSELRSRPFAAIVHTHHSSSLGSQQAYQTVTNTCATTL